MITLEHASRWHRQVIGVNDITCFIPAGITALLGPNGAGKSTLLKMITGQIRPTTGKVKVFGETPFANPRVYKRLGYCPEIENSYDDMTGREFVTMLGAMAGLKGADLTERARDSIETVGMAIHGGRKIGGYSKGMRQRIKVAQGIVHDPDMLILDEPLNGLDPVGRREITDVLHQFAARGKGVLISSHILYEVEQMTTNIMLMNRGRLLAQGNVYQIRNLIDRYPHRIAITSPDARRIAGRLLELSYILSAKFDSPTSDQVEIETRSPELFYAQFPDLILNHGFDVVGFESPDNNLESVFRYLVG